MKAKISRRSFGKVVIAAPIAASAVAVFAVEPPKSAPGKAAAKSDAVTYVNPETDAVAKALKYVEDATKATRVDKMGVKAAEQKCGNCALYTKTTDAYGKCTMLQSGHVKSAGWCNSWIKKG